MEGNACDVAGSETVMVAAVVASDTVIIAEGGISATVPVGSDMDCPDPVPPFVVESDSTKNDPVLHLSKLGR